MQNGNAAGAVEDYQTLLLANPKPSRHQIVDHMEANLCRCGAYGRIKRAVARAAEIQAPAGGDS